MENLLDSGQFLLLGLVGQADGSGAAHRLLHLLVVLLHPLDILQTEFILDDGHVTRGVDISFNVDDIGVVECSNHLENTVDCTDVRQEGVSETGTGGCTSGKTGDINTGQIGSDGGLGLVQIDEPVMTGIRYEDSGLFGVASVKVRQVSEPLSPGNSHGRVREVGSVGELGLGQQVEET